MAKYEPVGMPEKSPADEVINYYFTFTQRSELKDHYVIIYDTYDNARTRMINLFGDHWAFQYKTAKEAGIHLYHLKCLISL